MTDEPNTEEVKQKATVEESTGAPPAMPSQAPTTPLATREKLVATAPIVQVGARAMIVPRNMQEAMEVAKLMSRANGLVGPHLFGNPGGCLGVTLQAMAWGMSPYAVAQKTYVAEKAENLAQMIEEGKPIPPIAYEAQLIHAVVLALAPTMERPTIEFAGEGLAMRCIVSATFRGDSKPSPLKSEPLAKLKRPRGSPLWETKPEQQLAYNTVRDWARRYCPDVILGVYTGDEMAEMARAIEERPAPKPFEGEGPKQLPAAGISSPLADTSGAAQAEAAPVSSSGDDTERF